MDLENRYYTLAVSQPLGINPKGIKPKQTLAITLSPRFHDQNGEPAMKTHTVLVPMMELRLALISKPARLDSGTHELMLGDEHRDVRMWTPPRCKAPPRALASASTVHVYPASKYRTAVRCWAMMG